MKFEFLIVLWAALTMVYATAVTFAAEYTLEYWLPIFLGHAVDIPKWMALIIGFVSGPVLLPATVITFLLSFVMK